jgi:hypothetical protein
VTASIWEPIVAGAAVVVALVMATALVGTFLVWRYGRRKWRALRSHGLVVGATSLWETVAAGRTGARTPMSAEDTTRWTARRVRRQLWEAVDRADAAVRAADGVGAPTAELGSLCRRLGETAVRLDQVLRVDPGAAVPPDVGRQVAEVVRAAGDLQQAAVASASEATAGQVAQLTRDAAEEIDLLDAGLASARTVLPRSHH